MLDQSISYTLSSSQLELFLDINLKCNAENYFHGKVTKTQIRLWNIVEFLMHSNCASNKQICWQFFYEQLSTCCSNAPFVFMSTIIMPFIIAIFTDVCVHCTIRVCMFLCRIFYELLWTNRNSIVSNFYPFECRIFYIRLIN